jgi:thiamine-phosphate diphosphorylase/hydroxyethylthiazole kinase
MATSKIFDLSVYLIADTSVKLPEGTTFLNQVRLAIEGGVTIVQLRAKNGSDDEVEELALQVQDLCKEYGVTFIINDRIELAKKINPDGVHIGQEDLPYLEAKKILGEDKIIGLSTGTVEEAKQAGELNVDYVGIGAAYSTSTKKLKRLPIGPRGIGEVLSHVPANIPACAIGGISLSNLKDTLDQIGEVANNRKLNGIAIASALMADQDPKVSASAFKDEVAAYSQQ